MIAFIAEHSLQVVDLSTREVRTIVEHEKILPRPFAWSPDGSQLIFPQETPRGEAFNWDLWSIDFAGGEPRNLSQVATRGGARCPAWSPDGTKFAYVQDLPGGVYLMHADGSHKLRLTEHAFRDELPAWSPDGTQLAFVGYVDDGARLPLCVCTLPDEAEQKADVREIHRNGEQACWTPDGARIVFVAPGENRHADLFSISPDGGNLKNLTNSEAAESWPRISPDGKFIAYVARADQAVAVDELRLLELGSGNVSRVCEISNVGWMGLCWSPDGHWLTFTQSGGNAGLFIVSAQAEQPPEQIVPGKADIPVWRTRPQ